MSAVHHTASVYSNLFKIQVCKADQKLLSMEHYNFIPYNVTRLTTTVLLKTTTAKFMHCLRLYYIKSVG